MDHLKQLKEDLKALEDYAERLTAESGTIHMKQHFNKKMIKLLKEEIEEAEKLESSVETLVKITEK